MKSYPDYFKRHIISLDGIWEFDWLGDEVDWKTLNPAGLAFRELMPVPGVFDFNLERPGHHGVGIYRKKIRLICRSERLKLKINGMGLLGKIWFDGKFIAEYDLPYSGMEYELPVTERRDEHELIIAIDNRFNFDPALLFQPGYDFYGFGGIYRSVELHQLPPCSIDRVKVTPLDITQGTVLLDIKLDGKIPAECVYSLGFDGGATRQFTATPVDGHIILETRVPDFKVWSPENPHLHTVEVDIGADAVCERFGMRTVRAESGKIMLNGSPLLLSGFNRHESHPQFGPVQPLQLMVEDLQWLKKMNCNFIRCVHYPQDQRFLDLCDQFGFLVWEESLGWGNKEAQLINPEFIAKQETETVRMVHNSCNHPSIIIWGFLNEAESNLEAARPLFQRLTSLLRETDGSRLVSFASCRGITDCCLDFVDVISMNLYPGWFGNSNSNRLPKTCIAPDIKQLAQFACRADLRDKPMIISEIGICAFYGCHDLVGSQWTEEFQRDYMAEAVRAVFAEERICGLALWQMFDARSYGSEGPDIRGKPRGYNCAGVLDEYRRPKLSAAAVGDLFGKLLK